MINIKECGKQLNWRPPILIMKNYINIDYYNRENTHKGTDTKVQKMTLARRYMRIEKLGQKTCYHTYYG